MSKGRMISSEIWEDDYFIELSMMERLIWIGLLTCSADDQGRLLDNSRLIHSQLFPVDDVNDSQIDQAITKFSRDSKILRYSADGRKLIQIRNWWRYQSPRWCGKSKYKPPEKWIDRERYHGQGNTIIEKNWKLPGGFSEDSKAPNTINDVNGDGDVNGDSDGDIDGEGERDVKYASSDEISNASYAWNHAIGDLLREVPKQFFETYVSTLTFEGVEGGVFKVRAINQPTADLVNKRYGETLNKCIQGYFGSPTKLQIIV